MNYWDDDILMHSGIKGQKWGIRRYQNEDGSLTEAGKKRYYSLTTNYAKAKSKEDRYSAKSDKLKYKAGSFVSTFGSGNRSKKQLIKAAKLDHKALKQSNKANKQKKRIEKLMKKTNMNLDQVYSQIQSDPVTYERLKMMFS